MKPKKISMRQKVFTYLKNNPNANKEALEKQFKGEPWNTIKTYKNQFWKAQEQKDISDINSSKNGVTKDKSPLRELTPNTIKEMILEELNIERSPQMLKTAIEYIKTFSGKETIPELDMEQFYLIGNKDES